MLDRQIELEELFAKNQLIRRIKHEFLNEPYFDTKFAEIGLDPDFGYAVLVQMALHKRADVSVLIGTVRYHFDSLQQVADNLLVMAQHDLIDWDGETEKFVVRYTISDDVQAEIDLYQYPLPMLVVPRELKENTDSGYVTFKASAILRDNHTDDDICLDHLNRLNKVKFTLDMDTAYMIKNKWRHLDKMKPGETATDYQKRVKAFNKYDRSSKEVMEIIDAQGEGFYMTHRYDKRGRTYSQGYHINYQGNAWNKAVIQFHNKEKI